MDEYLKFRDFHPVNRSELLIANNYICGQLNSYRTHYTYYYDMYSYATKCFIVLEWKKKIIIIKLQDSVKRFATINLSIF